MFHLNTFGIIASSFVRERRADIDLSKINISHRLVHAVPILFYAHANSIIGTG